MQAFVPSVSGETRQGFLRRFVHGLEQGGLDDVFARFPGHILNVQRQANGGASYVLDPRQNNRPVPRSGMKIDCPAPPLIYWRLHSHSGARKPDDVSIALRIEIEEAPQ